MKLLFSLFFINIVLFAQSTDSSLVLVNSIPQDAYVYSNDSLIGHTPILIDRDLKSIKLSKPGYSEQNYIVNQNINNILLQENKLQNGRRFYEKPTFKYLTASLIVLGGISAYYKIKADKNYDEYKVSNNNDFLKKTNRFDTISGISFGLLQINFGILVYYFINDNY